MMGENADDPGYQMLTTDDIMVYFENCKKAEARLAAKRAARAEAREIRMRELERQQKEKYYGLDNLDNKWGDIEQWMEDSERYAQVSRRHTSVSDDEERMSVGSRSNIRLDFDGTGAYSRLHNLQLPQASSSSTSHKKSKKKKKHSSKTSSGYDDDLSVLSSRGSRLSDESKKSRSTRLDRQSSAYSSSDVYSSSCYSSKHHIPSYNGYQGSVYEDSIYSGSRHTSARASSEYSGFLGSSSRTSSRANSTCGSPVEDCSSSLAGLKRSTSNLSAFSRDLENIIIPDLPMVNGRLSLGSSRASTISGTTLTSLGGTSSRRGSCDTSISADTEASIREIKEIHELKDQIQDVEAKHMQNLKELKDSLMEVEEKYRKAMVSNAQLDNEKTNMMYEVDTLKDSLMELEEMLFETRRELDDKSKDLERERHAHSILQFQFNELKETLKQSEELLTEIRQLRLKQDGFVSEISDLQETIEWKNKKIGALERQKEFSDAIRNERDELRDEVVQLKDILKKHGIVLGPDLAANGVEGEEIGNSDLNCAEIREGSSVLGTRRLKLNEHVQRDFNGKVLENEQSSQTPLGSTNTQLGGNLNGDLGTKDVDNLENRPEELPNSAVVDVLTSKQTTVEVESKEEVLQDNIAKVEMEKKEIDVGIPSHKIKKEMPLESILSSIHSETIQSVDEALEEQSKLEPNTFKMDEPDKPLSTSVTNKKKKKKKKNKKQKQSDKPENHTDVIDGNNEKAFREEHLIQKVKNGNVSGKVMNPQLPANSQNASVSKEVDGTESSAEKLNADVPQNITQLVTTDSTETNPDSCESNNKVFLDFTPNADNSSNTVASEDSVTDVLKENPEQPLTLFHEEMVCLLQTPSEVPENCAASISKSENLLIVGEKNSNLDQDDVEKEEFHNTSVDEDQGESPQMDSIGVEDKDERMMQEKSDGQLKGGPIQLSLGEDMKQEVDEVQEKLDEEHLEVADNETALFDTPIPEKHRPLNEANQEAFESFNKEAYVDGSEEISSQAELEELGEDEADQVKTEKLGQELVNEEDVGKSFDFDEMKLEASTNATLKGLVDPPEKDHAQEASQESQSSKKDQTLKDECLDSAQEETLKEKEDGNELLEKEEEGCSKKFQVNNELSPHEDGGDTTEEPQKVLEDVMGVGMDSEMKTTNVGTSRSLENQKSDISGGQEGEKEIIQRHKEERKESKKSGKSKGKGKGKEESNAEKCVHGVEGSEVAEVSACSSSSCTSPHRISSLLHASSHSMHSAPPTPEIRLRKLVDERENLIEQVKRLKCQLEQKKGGTGNGSSPDGDVLENGADSNIMDLQRDANRQINDLKFKLVKSEQEITALEQNVTRLEGQVTRYKSASENAEKVEDDLKAEKRKLQRELRSALDKIEELESSNSHLSKRLEKIKTGRGTAGTP
ncbi:hypothetical protein DNTS_005428 [Danionella cerebrum]|uniref:Leucine-rich repeat flightless-interacting protein 2-like n=1 Tax=Danionella cerebrum TaxID=2873325 RepID=A0A553RKN6_9TELE|nr:hypothetical protein DNTS_005428 [Danionella translucida]